MKFEITIDFLYKRNVKRTIEAKCGYRAITQVLDTLGSVEKDNIVGIKITDVTT